MDITSKFDSSDLIVILISTFFVLNSYQSKQSNLSLATATGLLYALASFWENRVTETTPEPYLVSTNKLVP